MAKTADRSFKSETDLPSEEISIRSLETDAALLVTRILVVEGWFREFQTHAIHSCGISEDDGSIVYGGEAAGYVLRFEDGRVVYLAGDTNVFTDMELIANL
jgi:hypothetical protein